MLSLDFRRFINFSTWIASLLLLGILACGSSSPGDVSANAPTISVFSTSSSKIVQGDSVTLSWTVAGATSLSLNQGIGTVTGSSIQVTPPLAGDISYILTATNAAGSTTKTVLVTVSELQDGWNFQTGANSKDLIANTPSTYVVSIALDTLTITSSSPALKVGATINGSTTLSLDGNPVITIAKDAYGFSITSDMPDSTYVEFALSGTYTGSITLTSDEKCKLALNGVTIRSNNGPALNIQSKKRTFIILKDGTTNTLSDSTTWSTRYLADGVTEMDLKATLFAEGSLIFSGSGTLNITGNKKHVICSDNHLRICQGKIALISNAKEGIRAKDAFIMDGGSLTITATADKGIKVEGKEDDKMPLGFVVINDGTLQVTSYDKAISASFEAKDGETADTADDPDPFVIINGGTITLRTTGTPYEDPNPADGDSSLSPEGIESKSVLTINGGTLAITTTDDALSATKGIVIHGGNIYAHSSVCDAIDSNGPMTITGGVVVAEGTGSANSQDGGWDCNKNTFTITGGTFIGIGDRNSSPTASSCTQNSVMKGATSQGLLVIRDSNAKIVFAYRMPYACDSVLCGTPDVKTGTTYAISTGGSLGSYEREFYGLYLGLGTTTYSGGTAGPSFTISSALTNLP